MNEDIEARLLALEAFGRRIRQDRWIGATLSPGGRPTLPVIDTLPTAGPEFAYQLVTIRGAAGVADISYQCLRDAAAAWGWRILATG